MIHNIINLLSSIFMYKSVYISLFIWRFRFAILLPNIFSLPSLFVIICRLFLMLQRFPVESKGRRKKLQEVFSSSLGWQSSSFLWLGNSIYLFSFTIFQVGYVTTICFTCFLIRCIMVCVLTCAIWQLNPFLDGNYSNSNFCFADVLRCAWHSCWPRCSKPSYSEFLILFGIISVLANTI